MKLLILLFSALILPTFQAANAASAASLANKKPNILWIFVDDMSDWMGCYGYEQVETPNIDALADAGVRFERAYMPSPVCSTTRSAIITGTMQTTHGLHRHRTMLKKPLPAGVFTLPSLLKEAGYLTFNESKEDYNFTYEREDLFSEEFERLGYGGHFKGRDVSFLEQLKGKPFFGQIQLSGGKFEGETGSKYPMPSRVDEASVHVPAHYPDTPVIRNAIARHYEQVVETDEQVGAIVAGLKEYGLWDNTIVFFFTDHGAPLPRAKQFLYEEGTKVPLILRFPPSIEGAPEAGTVREDLVNGIDITATTVALGGLEIPASFEGHDLFAADYQPQEFVISARDRCGIAVDRIRAVGTERFRYIRNYLTDRAFYQAQYRDKHASIIELRRAYADGEMTPLQASYMSAETRPEEELYDLEKDPDQLNNLAKDPEYASVLKQHRQILEEWIKETGDQGQEMDSPEELKAVYDYAKGNVESPEYNFLREENQ